jgi:PAS domain S-box-containing protein/putative nucleotidyltransferase with HDIG domain
VLPTVVRVAAQLLGAQAGTIHLYDPRKAKLDLTAIYGPINAPLGTKHSLGEGVVGRVAQSEQALIVRDYANWDGRSPQWEQEEVGTVLGVPLLRLDQLLGVLTIDRPVSQPFDESDVKLATLFANQAAIAIQNARTVAATSSRVTELTALREVSLQLTQSLDLDTVLDTIAESAVSLVDATDAHIFLYHEDTDEFVFGSGAWTPGREGSLFKTVRENGLTATVAARGEPVVINEARTHVLFKDEVDEDRIVDAIAGFPLRRANQVLGVFNVAFLEPHTFDQDELRVLTLLADQAAIAIENARLYEETDRRLKESRTLQEISQLVNSSLEADEILQTVVDKLQSAFGYSLVSIYTVHGDELHLGAQVGYDIEAALQTIPLSNGITGRVARSGEPALVADVTVDPDYLAAGPETVSEIAVPIQQNDHVLGVLNVESSADTSLTEADLNLLSSMAHQVSVAMQNAELYHAAQQELADRKRAEESYRAVVDHSLQGLAIIQDSLIVFANQAAVDILGYTIEELMALTPEQVRDLIHRDDQESVWGRLLDWEPGRSEPSRYDCRLVRKDGEVVWVEVFANATEYQGRPSIQAAVVDITGRKSAQEELHRSYLALTSTLEETVNALAALAEIRDVYTAGHQQRVAQLACAIAERMGLSEEEIRGLSMAGMIHDIGKIHVPAEILANPRNLTELETEMIRTHPQNAYDILRKVDFPWPVADIVLQHHERLDGSGYPKGLKEKEILQQARILAVADVMEAMASDRPYRSAHSLEETLQEITANAGDAYDPEVVDALMALLRESDFDLASLTEDPPPPEK